MKWFKSMRLALRPNEREVVKEAVQAMPDDDRLASLTPREREVFALLIQGKKQREIAVLLGVQPTTAGFHTQSLYRKLGIHDRAQLFIRYALPGRVQSSQESNEGEEE